MLGTWIIFWIPTATRSFFKAKGLWQNPAILVGVRFVNGYDPPVGEFAKKIRQLRVGFSMSDV